MKRKLLALIQMNHKSFFILGFLYIYIYFKLIKIYHNFFWKHDTIWTFKLCFNAKPLLHILQKYGRSCVWTLKCLRQLERSLVEYAQMLQWNFLGKSSNNTFMQAKSEIKMKINSKKSLISLKVQKITWNQGQILQK